LAKVFQTLVLAKEFFKYHSLLGLREEYSFHAS
jgi:hypothetical protein